MASPEVIQAWQYLPDRIRPEAISEWADEVWEQAHRRANSALLWGHINAELLPLQDPYGPSHAWWGELLKSDALAASLALLDLDTQYVVWNVSTWPEEAKPLLPAYRRSLTTCVIEAYSLVRKSRTDLQAEIDDFEKIDLRMPDGLPIPEDLSTISDPKVREEYRRRLAEELRQSMAKDRLDEIENCIGQMEQDLPDQFDELMRGASDSEYDTLAKRAREARFEDSPLGHSLILRDKRLRELMQSP